MFAKLFSHNQKTCFSRANFHFNLMNTKAEDVCCTLNTRKVEDHVCKGPQDCCLQPATIKVIIHGWLETKCMPHYNLLVEQYLRRESLNVIRVDWGQQAFLDYSSSVRCSVSVGKYVAKFVVGLLEAKITTHERVHIIGHCLGAHIAGIVGKEITLITGKQVSRITGLDPAKQLFEESSCASEVCLQNTDACMVDVTHTDCMMFGFKQPLGTVDFYINGIGFQPGCTTPGMVVLTNVKEVEECVFCSHRRSLKYFTDSINNCGMVGRKCQNLEEVSSKPCDAKDTIVYGENTPPTAKGLYFVQTGCN